MIKDKILTLIIILTIISAPRSQTTSQELNQVIEESNTDQIVQIVLNDQNNNNNELKEFSDKILSTDLENKEVKNKPGEQASLPSLSEYQILNYANYSAGDAEIDRVNTGQLLNSTDENVWLLNPKIGPAHGVYCFSLTWAEEEGEDFDIDLNPVWYIEQTEPINGYPSYANELEEDYYGGSKSEYYYVEVDVSAEEEIKMGAKVLGFDNEILNYILNVTWINYENWIHETIIEAPHAIIYTPYEGEKVPLPVLLNIPQRSIVLNYSYVNGLAGFWNETSYEMTDYAIKTSLEQEEYYQNYFRFRILINGISYGLTSEAEEIYLGLTEVGGYIIEIECEDRYKEILSSRSVSFEVVGIELGEASYSYTNYEVLSINQSFILPVYSEENSSSQAGTGIKEVNLFYLKNGTEEWMKKTMEKISGTWYGTSLEMIPSSFPMIIYYEVIDEYNCQYLLAEYGIEISHNTTIEVAGSLPTSENTSDDASIMQLLNLWGVIIILVITRRKKN
jgi:hypothetical protein